MDSRTFLGLEQSHNPFRWSLPVTRSLATAGDFLFGGCGLGAAISAMEGTSGRGCVWATAQYLSYAKPGEVMDIDVTIAVAGHQITQARAVCHVGNREILTVNAALGDRPMEQHGQWVTDAGRAAAGRVRGAPAPAPDREHGDGTAGAALGQGTAASRRSTAPRATVRC